MKRRVLVICEKPISAKRIAQALDENNLPNRFWENKSPSYVANNKNLEIIVVSALGHLFTVTQNNNGWTYPIFDIKWVPSYLVNKSAKKTERYIKNIKKLSFDIDEYVSACDYDIEGSLIAYMILLKICGKRSIKKAKRMKFSTLTDIDIITAWNNKSDNLNIPLIEAGKTRHEIDWIYGINLSRALSISLTKATGMYKTISIGRVQGPTLNLIKEKEIQINSFVPIPFWEIKLKTRISGKKYTLEYNSTIKNLKKAENIKKRCQNNNGIITQIISKKVNENPPPLFNLGDLQREAYNKFKYSPNTTLKAAENLYLNTFISYPRTSSQKLLPSIDYLKILKDLRNIKEYEKLVELLLSKSEIKPKQGKKDDLAHPAIHPTGKLPHKLSKIENKIYDLICRRFMAIFGDPIIRIKTKATVDVNGYIFYLKGIQIYEEGWKKFYSPYIKERQILLPSLNKDMLIPIMNIKIIERYSKHPSRYNFGSILKLLEDKKIGTKTTRTNIIDTLIKRGYIDKSPIKLTNLGFSVVDTLNKYCPKILSTIMTRELENDLEAIQTDQIQSNIVIEKAVNYLKPILENIKKKEKIIGIDISKAINKEFIYSNSFNKHESMSNYYDEVSKNLKTSFEFWRKAFDITWIDFLNKVIENSESGTWVKKIALNILNTYQNKKLE